MSQPPNQPYPGQPHPEQPGPEDPWPGQPYPGPSYPGQPQPDQPYPGQSYPDQGYPGQPQSGQPYPGPATGEQPWSGQSYPGQPAHPGQPYPGQPGYPGQPYPGQPGYPGQPYQGQPNPDVPSSVPPQPGYPAQPAYVQQPSYPQPDYAGYPQPGYPQAGPPLQGYPPAPKKKSKALPITMVSIALVLVVCVGGSTAIYLAGRNTAEGLVDVYSSEAPTPRATDRTEPTEDATTITIAEPKTLSGRPKVTDPTFATTADQLEKSLALLPGASQTVGAVYGTPSKQDLVLVVAAKSFVADPKTELENAFSGSNVDSLKLTGITSIPAGPLGGVAKCAKGKGGGSPLSMCAWADEGSSGWVIWYFTSLSKAKAEFIKVRSQVEKKSN